MVKVARVEATISANNRLRPGLAAASADLNRFRATQTRAFTAMSASAGRAMLGIGGVMAGHATARGLAQATTRFAEVERAMQRTGITGDATVETTREGTRQLRDLARETGTLFDPAQKGLDAITASGRNFTEAMAMMPSVLRTAQASGAGVEEIANSSTALLDHMKISVEGLAEAQDTLAKGGKLGKFELKDMARYLPSMLPAFKALGAEGQSGLRELVALLQVIRSGTGTAEEAAASASNIFQKMESEETVKRFEKFGVNLREEMTKARQERRNLLEVFVELSNVAIKGDLSKVPQLFADSEVARGMRALLTGTDKYREMLKSLQDSRGTMASDFTRIAGDTQFSVDQLKEAADRAKTALGELASEVASPMMKSGAGNLDQMAQAMERAAAAAREGGLTGAVKAIGEDLGTRVKAGQDEHRENWKAIEDKAEADALAKPDKGGWFDWVVGDTSRNATQKALDDLREKEKRRPLSYFDKVNKRTFEDRLAKQDDAWSRDQMRRVGALPAPLTSASPEFDAQREADREARRARSFSRSDAPEFPRNGKTRRGEVQPSPRPSDLNGGGLMVPYAEEVKEKNEAAAQSFGLLGPAAQAAGSTVTAGLAAVEGSLDSIIAKISRAQQALSSLRAPTLSFGGLGNFPTGKQGPE